jgi:hypothetical protein
MAVSRSRSNERPSTEATPANSRAPVESCSARDSTASASVSGTLSRAARNSSTCSGMPSLRANTVPVTASGSALPVMADAIAVVSARLSRASRTSSA